MRRDMTVAPDNDREREKVREKSGKEREEWDRGNCVSSAEMR